MEIELNGFQIVLILLGCYASWEIGRYAHVWSKWPYLAIKSLSRIRVRTTDTHLIIEQKSQYDFCYGCNSREWLTTEDYRRHIHAPVPPPEERTMYEIFESMTEDQKQVLYYTVGEALDSKEVDDERQYADNLKYLNIK